METREHRIKRLKMRSMRRGIKEMDIILTTYADRALGDSDEAALQTYDAFLHENDHDLYQWVTGQIAPPPDYSALIADIQAGINEAP